MLDSPPARAFFFFKQKTAYELRPRDWSSDVCSSDLLLTTLYGAVIATVFALPIADKLALRSNEERLTKSMILESISAIQEGLNPRMIEGLLSIYLPTDKKSKGDDAANAEAA